MIRRVPLQLGSGQPPGADTPSQAQITVIPRVIASDGHTKPAGSSSDSAASARVSVAIGTAANTIAPRT